MTSTGVLIVLATACSAGPAGGAEGLRLDWKDNMLTARGPAIPGGDLKVWYMEAYCRGGSTRRKWDLTTIPHKTRLVSADPNARELALECTLQDGVVVRHAIRAGRDEVDFRLTATNPTKEASAVQWAQPCLRVGGFTGGGATGYLGKCFLVQDGKLTRMPTARWETKALYTPGQVWCPRHVSREDVNPRPLNPLPAENGLVGCFSADDRMILAVAFEPYQELFQGVITCIHSDFRIGGLAPGQSKKIRGKLYLVPADVDALLKRYQADFPEHFGAAAGPASRPDRSPQP